MSGPAPLSVRANRTQRHRAVGGRLEVGPEGILFRPHVVERLFGGKPRRIEAAQIAGIAKQAKTGNPLDGGLRERLRVDLRDGGHELFVVPAVDETVERVRAALRAPLE